MAFPAELRSTYLAVATGKASVRESLVFIQKLLVIPQTTSVVLHGYRKFRQRQAEEELVRWNNNNTDAQVLVFIQKMLKCIEDDCAEHTLASSEEEKQSNGNDTSPLNKEYWNEALDKLLVNIIFYITQEFGDDLPPTEHF